MYYPVLILGILATILFIFFRVNGGGIRGLISKTLASSLFICTSIAAFSASGAKDISFPYLVIAGLVFGLLGDIWLDLKWVYPRDNDIYTFAGFTSFGIGHILYLIGLFICFADFSNFWYIIIPIIAAIAVGIGVVMLEKPMKLVYGKFKTISGIYASILTYMTLQSGCFALQNSFDNMTLNYMFAGGILFLISDLILSGTYFGEGKRRPVDVISNHVAYYAAQYIIASSLLFIG